MDDNLADSHHDDLPEEAPAAADAVDQAAVPASVGESQAAESEAVESDATESEVDGDPTVRTAAQRKRRRGSRGGKNRKKPAGVGGAVGDEADDDDDDDSVDDGAGDDRAPDGDAASNGTPTPAPRAARTRAVSDSRPELPERIGEGRPSAEAAEKALVRKPQIGDTRPAPAGTAAAAAPAPRAGGKGRDKAGETKPGRERSDIDRDDRDDRDGGDDAERGDAAKKKRRRSASSRSRKPVSGGAPVTSMPELDPDVLERRRGRERKGRPVGRYLMCVQVRPTLTQVAVLEGRTLIEHYVSRPADDVGQIHGNIYLGKVQNVLPGMEAAFVDIGTPKNAVLYRGDVQYNEEDIVEKSGQPRIEQMLKARQLLLCQVTKNPIGAKGARLTQEVSLPGRFVVLIPNSKTYGISKRLPDDVRKRLRTILDRVKPNEHGLIVRTAAEHATEHELRADMTRLLDQWNSIEAKAKRANGPTLLYREPELAVRVIREEFNAEYRGVVIDDQRLHDDVHDYIGAFNPELADRVEHYDATEEGLPIFERFHIHEQLHKALDRKVWLPSGGSLIIEHTEALTVIDVNTGKNVGTSNLEQTVFHNNLEAAEEVAKQLRLRDIGGIVVIDFIDMEIKDNRRKVVDSFRSALARDKTRTQVFDITELGLVEMTRKRIGEGLLVNFADQCPNCEGRGVMIDHALLD